MSIIRKGGNVVEYLVPFCINIHHVIFFYYLTIVFVNDSYATLKVAGIDDLWDAFDDVEVGVVDDGRTRSLVGLNASKEKESVGIKFREDRTLVERTAHDEELLGLGRAPLFDDVALCVDAEHASSVRVDKGSPAVEIAKLDMVDVVERNDL